MALAKYTLPPLPYAYDAREPQISAQIMTLHHTKHHQTYITNLNAALSTLASADIISHLHLQKTISFNAGGHINHTLFWSNLCPSSSPSASPSSAPRLSAALTSRFGSVEKFQDEFTKVLLGIKGSGWGWLVQDTSDGHLEIVMTKDQEIVGAGKKPLVGVDMWEHAYYLQYLNDKACYARRVWKVVNWERAEGRFLGDEEKVWGLLKGLKSGL